MIRGWKTEIIMEMILKYLAKIIIICQFYLSLSYHDHASLFYHFSHVSLLFYKVYVDGSNNGKIKPQ